MSDSESSWLTRERALVLVLVAATVLAFYLCSLLVRPFLSPLAWALALAVVAHRLHGWLERRTGRPNLAAGLSVVIVALTLLCPTLFVLNGLVREVAANAELLQGDRISETWQLAVQRWPRLSPALEWISHQFDLAGDARALGAAAAAQASSYVTGSLWVAAQVLITLFLLFYFFRDRKPVLRTVRQLMPLSADESDKVFARVEDTIIATIYGSLTVAAIQGTLGGLIFWVLGLPTPLFWGVVMGLLAVVPVLGTFVIWMPAAVYLAISGEWGKALILAVWGSTVIALIDNFVYPLLVGKRLRLHPVLVFIAVVGGVSVFGAAGLVLGPVTLSITDALVETWRRRTWDGGGLEAGVDG